MIKKVSRKAKPLSPKMLKAKKELQKTLRKSGYFRSLGKYGSSKGPDFPSLKVESNCAPTSDTFTTVIGKKQRHPDAKDFPIQTPHKQGPMLLLKHDGYEYAGGKKS